MCLILIAIDSHPMYPLIIAANRDEYYNRATAPLAFWDDHPNLLAGRDLVRSGTWLGVSRAGRWAAVTNYRMPGAITAAISGKISRGLLVSRFIAGTKTAISYTEEIEKARDRYDGFNLVSGKQNQIYWYSNMNGGILRMPSGIHGISNHLLNTPWPKLTKAKSKFGHIIEKQTEIVPDSIFEVLEDTSKPMDHLLPDTGVGIEWERILSSIFIKSEIYGTRSSSIILVDHQHHLRFIEKTHPTPGTLIKVPEIRQFEFNI